MSKIKAIKVTYPDPEEAPDIHFEAHKDSLLMTICGQEHGNKDLDYVYVEPHEIDCIICQRIANKLISDVKSWKNLREVASYSDEQ